MKAEQFANPLEQLTADNETHVARAVMLQQVAECLLARRLSMTTVQTSLLLAQLPLQDRMQIGLALLGGVAAEVLAEYPVTCSPEVCDGKHHPRHDAHQAILDLLCSYLTEAVPVMVEHERQQVDKRDKSALDSFFEKFGK